MCVCVCVCVCVCISGCGLGLPCNIMSLSPTYMCFAVVSLSNSLFIPLAPVYKINVPLAGVAKGQYTSSDMQSH